MLTDFMIDKTALIPILYFVLIFAVIVVLFLILKPKQKNESLTYVTSEKVVTENNAVIIAKRTITTQNTYECKKLAVFELENSDRVELVIDEFKVFYEIAEGDRGILKYSEKKFIGFERNT